MVNRDIYMKKIRSFIDHELIKVITGIKRCGKSYLLNMVIEELLERGVCKENIILINFDKKPYNHIDNARELDLIVDDLIKPLNGKVYLFFDEIQNVNEWEKSVNSYKLTYNCDIYITGSNSKMLSGELATHLTGRYIQIKMYPLSFKEFTKLNENKQLKELFDEYLTYGGMPAVSAMGKEYKLEYLDQLYSSLLLNVVSKHNIRDVKVLKIITEYMMDNIAKPFSFKNIMNYLKHEKIKITPQTVYNYIEYLEEACLIYNVKNQELGVDGKYYAADQGFTQTITGRNKANISRVIENIVLIELLIRGWNVTIGKVGEWEIDFVCKKQDKKIYVQVTQNITDEKTLEREFRPLLEVKDNYPKYVISMDEIDMSHDGVIHMNIIDFLTGNKKNKI